MIHGDFHFRNIMYQNGESLLIDMDKLSYGHPVFELAAIYNSYCGFGEIDHSSIERFLGIPYKTTVTLWHKQLERYLDTKNGDALQEVENKVKLVGHTRLMQHYIRRNGLETEAGREMIAHSRSVLEQLLPRVDALTF